MCLFVTYYSSGQGVLQGTYYSGNCKACHILCKDGNRSVNDNSMSLILSITKDIVSMKIVRRIAWVTVGFTYFLIALGGTVRVSDSGLSCPDWPLCFGKAFDPAGIHVLLEQFHRYAASIVSVLIVSLVVSVLIWARKERQLLIPVLLLPVFLLAQIVLGALTVLMKLPPTIITAHLGTALVIFALVITVAVMSGQAKPSKEHPAKTRKFVS